MLLLRKVLYLVFFLMFVTFSTLQACGGSDGQGNDDWLAAAMGNEKALVGLGFIPIKQPEISGDTLDINSIDPLSLEELKKQMKDDIKSDMYWSDIKSIIYRLLGNAAETGRVGAKITVVTAAVTTAVLAANPEILAGLGGMFAEAEALGGAAQFGWGVGFSGATTAAKSAAEMCLDKKSTKRTAEDIAKAMIQSAILGAALPNNPAISNMTDGLLGEVDISKQTSAHFDGMVDYGPGYATTATGQRVMK
ncbi:MAG: hypothetical protein L3J44_02040 [Campylobacteraceae bacterium]|nr:hypothetical protein [Campylobacteraceae bacterium]